MKRVEKPWGEEIIWAITDKYVGKIIKIKKGHNLSLQHHEIKEETIMVLSGMMALRIGATPEEALAKMPLIMKADDVYHITPKTIHRMIALEDVVLIEVSTPELDDVVRHRDDYGRVG